MLIRRLSASAIVPGLAWSSTASAHGGLNIGGFYQGMATVVLHWEQVLFLLVTGLWCAQQAPARRPLPGSVIIAGMAAGLVLALQGFNFEPALLIGALAYAGIGLVVAAQQRELALLSVPIALGAGLANGLALGASELESVTQPWLFSLGLLLGAAHVDLLHHRRGSASACRVALDRRACNWQLGCGNRVNGICVCVNASALMCLTFF